MKIKSVKKIKSDKPINFYDITVDKYHNFAIGDSKIITHNTSLSKAISKLARPFGNALQMLDGYGFFGTEVSPEPAAARYTSVKLAPKPAEIIKKYKYLFTREEEGAYDPFWMDVPLGLTTGIVGIAVGYKTTVLPRKLEHIKEYFEGKRQSLKPYFEGFNGTVKKYKNIDKSWIISSDIQIIDKKIEVRQLPPVMKYASLLKKLDWFFQKFEGKIKVLNNSNKSLNIDIIYTGRSPEEWRQIQDYTTRIFSVIVTETPVFVKDGNVLVYDRIEEYLDDYRWQLLRLDARNKEYQRDWTSFELEYNKAKKEFIAFILQKRRSVKEVDQFIKPFGQDIKERLERLTSKKFTSDELKATTVRIVELEKELKKCIKSFNASQKVFESAIDPTLVRGISSKSSSLDLFDEEDMSEDNGIEIWDGDDPFENDSQNDLE